MARTRRAIAVGLVLGAAVLSGKQAHAGDPDLERARALFEEAGELERHGNWGAAQDRLRQALKLRETPQLHYALGWALENEDKLIEAKAEYETTVKQGQNRSGSEEAVKLAQVRLGELDRKMPVIKVRVTGASKATARVIVDGKEVKRDEDIATAYVNPGSHVIRVERTGTDESIEQMAYVGRSTVRSIDVDTGDAVAARDTTQDRHAAAPLRMTEAAAPSEGVLPWILMAGGAGLVVGGIVVFAASKGDADARDEAQASWCVAVGCNANRATRAETPEAATFRREASDAADAGNVKQIVGVTLIGAGLGAAAVGAYLYVNNKRAPSAAHASVTPLPGGGGYASASFAF